jgi:hypothetical protein
MKSQSFQTWKNGKVSPGAALSWLGFCPTGNQKGLRPLTVSGGWRVGVWARGLCRVEVCVWQCARVYVWCAYGVWYRVSVVWKVGGVHVSVGGVVYLVQGVGGRVYMSVSEVWGEYGVGGAHVHACEIFLAQLVKFRSDLIAP